MKKYLDKIFIKTLSGILRKGAKIGYREDILFYRNQNYYLVLDAPGILTADLQKQTQYSRLALVNPQ